MTLPPSSHAPTILGEVLFDCFPDGRRVLGGAPFNVATHLRGFGLDPLFVSGIGADEMGREILARMQRWSMRTDGIQIKDTVSTGRVDVRDADRSPTYHFPELSAWDLVEGEPLPPGAEAAPLLYQGSLFLRHAVSRQTSIQLGATPGARRFVDINLRPPWFTPEVIRQFLPGTHWLKVNEDELPQLCAWFDLPGGGGALALAERLMAHLGLAHCLVTLGKAGAHWIERDGATHTAPAPRPDPFVDSVGAGDAFAAVTIRGILAQEPPGQILAEATHFASRVCGLQGATPQNPNFYDHE